MNQGVHDVILMLGGNMGDTRSIFREALSMLSSEIGHPRAVSSLYKSQPWGYTDQPDFLNQALKLSTTLDPFQVLEKIHITESVFLKTAVRPNGPRTLDIDIMFYDNQILNSPTLTIPHPRMHLRRFNLAPLAEIIPEFVHPVLKESITTLLKNCKDPLGVIRQEPL